VIELPVDLNKVGWHFGQQRILVLDGDITASLSGARAPEPFVMRANSGDCVDYNHTNLVPSVYQLDDFQVKTPTDVIGQHIHLVKFDVTSADGSGNGWNYEDGTFSPHEVQERIHAFQASGFTPNGDPHDGTFLDLSGTPTTLAATPFAGPCPMATASQQGGCAGARTTRQRWYIDPGWTGNVFTHDHFGPSTHQQAGLYGTMLIEPRDSQWLDPATGTAYGGRADGGPTSWRADIIDGTDAYREFYLEFADFQIAYRSPEGDGAGFLNGGNQAVNPSYRNEPGLPHVLLPQQDPLLNAVTDEALGIPGCGQNPTGTWTGCAPEAISAADPGTFVVNMRNEPLAYRLRDPSSNTQATGLMGDLSYAFKSGDFVGKGKNKTWEPFLRDDDRLNTEPADWPYGIQTATQGALAGDPFTPLLQVYPGDKVSVRVQVGAHEEGHNFSINGIKWLQNWRSGVSGFRNSQMAGISEYFFFQVPAMAQAQGKGGDDYRYMTGSSVDAMWNGSWGLLRAYDDLQPDLEPLPSNSEPPFKGGAPATCPANAPIVEYEVFAVAAQDILGPDGLEYHPDFNDPTALLYVNGNDLEPDADGDPPEACLTRRGRNAKVDIRAPECPLRLKADRRVEPLILRANAGDCIKVTLFNRLPDAATWAARYDSPDEDGFNSLPMIVNEFNANQLTPSRYVGLHAQLVAYAMEDDDGMNVGLNKEQTIPPMDIAPTEKPCGVACGSYTWYAGNIVLGATTQYVPIEFGATNLMASDPIKGSNKGLIGALIIRVLPRLRGHPSGRRQHAVRQRQVRIQRGRPGTDGVPRGGARGLRHEGHQLPDRSHLASPRDRPYGGSDGHPHRGLHRRLLELGR